MAKKLTQAQKAFNALVSERARLAARKVRLEEQMITVNVELTNVATQLNDMRNKGVLGGSALNEYERALVRSGTGLIQAIKSLRERTNLGLKEAKDAVDAYRATLG